MGDKVSFWQRLRYRFKFTIVNETMFEEVFRFRMSLFRIIVFFGVLVLFLVLLTSYLIAFTSIKEWIPGYPDRHFRSEMLATALRLDSIQTELDKRDVFINSLHSMIGGGEFGSSSDDTAQISPQDKYRFDTIMFRLSEEEAAFRSAVEEEERFSLGLGLKPASQQYYHFFTPVTGYVTEQYNEKNRHYGTDIVTKKDAQVLAVLDGVVIFTDWTLSTGNVVAIQHANNLISIYKHNSVLLCKQGDYVRAGQVIANVGDTGNETSGPHLHFEMWRAGNPLNPEDFIQFK